MQINKHYKHHLILTAAGLMSSGGGGGGYSEVPTFADLPPAGSHTGEIWVVLTSTGTWLINRKEAGLYASNGSVWQRLGNWVDAFNATNFRLYDGSDTSKQISWNLASISPSNTRVITMPDSDITLGSGGGGNPDEMIICNMGDGLRLLTAGDVAWAEIGYAGTIASVRLLADQTGSIVVDIYKDSYANYPPDSGDSICASAKPTLTSASKYEDSTLTGWTKSITKGDILKFHIDSVSGLLKCSLILRVTKA